MKNFKKICDGIDVKPILSLLESHPELWREITLRQEYPASAHKDTESIFLRGPKTLTHSDYFFDIGAYDYPPMTIFAEELANIFDEIIKHMQITEFGRMLIVSLKPSGIVQRHVDEGLYADHYSRFHLALTSDSNAYLQVEDEKQHFASGEVWWLNHKREHSAHNPSDKPRINIIFDAVSPQFKVENAIDSIRKLC